MFWQKLKEKKQIQKDSTGVFSPITVLAPMEDVTDSSFRSFIRLANSCSEEEIYKMTTDIFGVDEIDNFVERVSGQISEAFENSSTNNELKIFPDVLVTEFTNCEGLNHPIGGQKVVHRLEYKSYHSPIAAQIWGITPEHYYLAAQKVVQLGFDGMDINMGCPVKNVIKMGACSALIKNPAKAKEIVEAAKSGLKGKIPLSIKTRLGFDKHDPDWIRFCIQELKPDALTVHFRSVKELSLVPAKWQNIRF